MPAVDQPDIDDQDQSEIFDEDNFEPEDFGATTNERRTFEENPQVLDVTVAAGDADDDVALIGEDLDDQDIVDLEAETQDADIEDDDLAGRMPEGLRGDDGRSGDNDQVLLDAERGVDAADRRIDHGGGSDVATILGGDMENFAEGQAHPAALEAERLSDDDIEDLGYSGDDAGKAADPVRFDIRLEGGLWRLSRDGHEVHSFSHADRAIHEGRELAQALRSTGQPAQVHLQAKGKIIEVTDDGAAPLDEPDEASAVVPDRSTDA